MGDHGPGGAAHREVRIGVRIDQLPPRGDGSLELLHRVQVVDGGAQHDGGVLVLRERIDEAQGAGHGFLPHSDLLRALGVSLVLAVGVDRGVSGRGGLLVGGIIVGGALVRAGRFSEVFVFEQEIRQAIVGGGRLGGLRERGEIFAVPVQGLCEVGGLLVGQLCLLVERVIVIREILEIGFQVAEDFRGVVGVEVAPVLGLQAVAGRELLLRLEDELREVARLEDLDHPHAEVRRGLVQGVELDERPVGGSGVVVAKLLEVELAKAAVDVVLVAPAPARREVLLHGRGAAQVGEAEADDAVGVGDPTLLTFVTFVTGPIEVVPGGDLVIEQSDVLVERLLVEFLLVERPTELVQGVLVVLGSHAHAGDRCVGLLGVEVLAPDEEVFGPPELDLVYVPGVRVLGDQLFDHGDRLVVAPQFVVGARLLVEDLVVVRVVRIGGEDLIVELDGFQGARPGRRFTAGKLEVDVLVGRGDLRCVEGTTFEVLLGLRRPGAARHPGSLGVRGPGVARRGGLLRCRQIDEHPVAEDPVLLLELQIREPAHGLGSPRGFGRPFEEAPVGGHGLVETVLHPHLGHVGLYVVELGEGGPVRIPRAGQRGNRYDEQSCANATHRFTLLTAPAPSRRGRSCRQRRSGPGPGRPRAAPCAA